MAVLFEQIPFNWLRKGNLAEIRPNYTNKGVLPWPTRVLIIGQMLTGIATAGTPVEISRGDQAAALFGAGSMLDMQVRAFKAANTTSEVWAVGLADAGGSTSNVRTITVAGTPSTAGTVPLWIAGRPVRVGYAASDTAATIATAIAAAVNADVSLPFTATAATATVTLTARNKGTFGNTLDVRVGYYSDDPLTPGVTFTIAQTTAGATDPSISSVLVTTANDWFTDIVVPWTDSATMSALETDLLRRYNALGGLDAHAYTCITGTYSAVTTWSATRNSPHVSTLAINGALEPPAVIASALAGLGAFHLGNDPSRQLGSLVLPGIKAPAKSALYTDTEQNQMLGRGLSTYDVLPDGTIVLNRVVTNYVRTSLGVADTAWLDIMVPKTMSRLRYDWNSFVSLAYPRAKLASDTSPALADPNPAAGVVTPRMMFGTYIARYRLWAQQGWVQDVEYAKANSTFEVNASDRNRLDAKLGVKLMGNLIVGAYALEFAA